MLSKWSFSFTSERNAAKLSKEFIQSLSEIFFGENNAADEQKR
jgi:hypothetical protein